MKRALLFGTVLHVLSAGLAAAAESGSLGEISGSYRNLYLAGDTPDGHFTHSDINRLRLEWRGQADVFSAGTLSGYLAYDHELFAGGLVGTPQFQAAARKPAATWLDVDAAIVRRSHALWRHRLYRGWLAWDAGDVQVKIGRQRLAWGSGQVWNPTDRFNPVDPTALERDEKTGVDGAAGEWRYSASGSLQLVAAPGRSAHAVSRKAALRLRDTFGEADIAVLGGRFGDETTFGADVAANVSDALIYGEWLLSRPRHRAPYSQFSGGLSYTLNNTLFPAGLSLLGEYFFNGAAGRGGLASSAERLNSRVRHLVALAAGYDVTPLIRLEISGIADAVKGSVFIAPRLTWSLAEDWDLSAFVLAFGGHRNSEFGDRANVYAAQLDVYF